MRILIATIFEYPHEGGLSTHVTTLKRGLEEHGHHVDIISGSDFPKTEKLLMARAPGYLLNRLNKGQGQIHGDLSRAKMLNKILQEIHHNYDVINTQDIFATLATHNLNVKVVQTVHGYYTYEAASRGAILENSTQYKRAKQLELEAYNMADHLICVDQRIKNYIVDEAGLDGTVIHNFVDPAIFNVSDSELNKVKEKYNLPNYKKLLLVPRRLTEKNGVIYPLLALPKIIETEPNTLLIYAGSGEQMELLKTKAKELGIEDYVKFLGSVLHQDIIGLYKLAHIVIVPSIHAKGVEEATSIAALEGMAAGKPVIAGAVGGLKEMIKHGENGLLFQERNVEELAKNIKEILTNEQLKLILESNAKKYVKNKSLDKAVHEYFSIYNKTNEKLG